MEASLSLLSFLNSHWWAAPGEVVGSAEESCIFGPPGTPADDDCDELHLQFSFLFALPRVIGVAHAACSRSGQA